MTQDDSPSHRLHAALAKIVWRLGRTETRAKMLGDAGRDLSAVDENLLRTIVANGPIRISDLAAWQGVDKSTITPQVRRLERRELVTRGPDSTDARAVLLTATARGRRTCQRIEASAVAVISEVLHEWSKKDQETLARLFSRFADDLTSESHSS